MLTETQKRVFTEPTAWTERYKRLWVTSIHSDSTVTTRAPASRTVPRTTKPTISLQARADALSHRLSRAGTSFATRRKRPATSEGAGEHGVHVSQRAPLRSKKSGPQGWVAGQHRGGMETRRRTRDPLKCGGGGGYVPCPLGCRCEHLRVICYWCWSCAQQRRPTHSSS